VISQRMIVMSCESGVPVTKSALVLQFAVAKVFVEITGIAESKFPARGHFDALARCWHWRFCNCDSGIFSGGMRFRRSLHRFGGKRGADGDGDAGLNPLATGKFGHESSCERV
jgi:hypothetical protein